jgi:hypothetical protein
MLAARLALGERLKRIVQLQKIHTRCLRNEYRVVQGDRSAVPPRLRLFRARAKSVRIRRITVAQTAKKCARSFQLTGRPASRKYTSLTSAVVWRELSGASRTMYECATRCSSS